MNSEGEFAVYKFSCNLIATFPMPVRIFVISANLFIYSFNKESKSGDIALYQINRFSGFSKLIVKRVT